MGVQEKTVLNDKIGSVKKKVNLKQIINILLILIIILFALQNLESIRVTLLFFSFEMPLFVLIIVLFSIGYFTTKIFSRNKN